MADEWWESREALSAAVACMLGVSCYLGSMLRYGDRSVHMREGVSACAGNKSSNALPSSLPAVHPAQATSTCSAAQCGHLSEREALCKDAATVRCYSTLVQTHHAIVADTRSHNTVALEDEDKEKLQDTRCVSSLPGYYFVG